MNSENKINQLRKIISDKLSPLIKCDYIHLDVPYHINIGDVLIWQGEHDFLKTIPYNCIETASLHWKNNKKIDKNTVFLLHGGGNFGDLYRVAQDFRLRIISDYPNNRIIIFPQSVWYEDVELIRKDVEIFSKHKDLYICARDQWSFDFLKQYFTNNNILLVPDMAFYIDDAILHTCKNKKSKKNNLYLRRIDKEFDINSMLVSERIDSDVMDWPTFQDKYNVVYLYYWLFNKIHGYDGAISKIENMFIDKIMRPYMVKLGLNFISQYNMIYTTRLHAMISGILLGRDIKYIDNSTKKLSAFANTWLNNLDNVSVYGL